MTQYVAKPSPDGVPVLEVVSRGIPGEAGDVALDQGRLDAQRGVYRPHLFPRGGFQQKIYEQGHGEITGRSAWPSRRRRRRQAVRAHQNPDHPARGALTAGIIASGAALGAVAGGPIGAVVGAGLAGAGATLVPEFRRRNPAPPLPPGVPVYGPAVPPGVLGLGQGCYSNYDCAPGEYCHSGMCLPNVWAGGVYGRGAGAQQVESIGGRPVRFNPAARFEQKLARAQAGVPRSPNPGLGPACNWYPQVPPFGNAGGWAPQLADPSLYPMGTNGWPLSHQMFTTSMLGPLRTPVPAANRTANQNPSGVGPLALALYATGRPPRNGPEENPSGMTHMERPLAPPDMVGL